MESETPVPIRIALTRAGQSRAILAEPLTERGFEVLGIPLLNFTGPDDWIKFDASARQLEDYSWLAFTSVRAVSATASRLKELGLRCELETLAIGPATYKAAQEAGFAVRPECAASSAAELASALLLLESGRVLMPRGQRTRGIFQSTLRKAGWQVDDPVVYCTKPSRVGSRALQAVVSNLAAIVFTSGGAAQAALDAVGAEVLAQLRVYSFGGSVADVLEPAGVPMVRLPKFSSMAEFATQIAIDLDQH